MPNPLQQLIDATPAGTTLTLQPTTYVIPVGQTTVNKPLTIAGVPGKTRFLFQQVPAHSTAIAIHSPGVTFRDLAHDTQNPVLDPSTHKLAVNPYRVYASHFQIRNALFANVDNAVFLEAAAAGAIIRNIANPQPVHGDLVYIGGTYGVTIDGLTSAGSTREHCIRIDSNPLNNANTAGQITIRNATLNQVGVKESLAGRTYIGPVTIDRCTFWAWVRHGQVGNPPPTLSAGKLALTNCNFRNGAYLQLNQGVIDAEITGNNFDAMAAYVPIHGNGPNLRATGSANRMITIPGQQWNGRYYDLRGMSPDDFCNPQFQHAP